jgi:hypothetical protein
MEIDRLDSPVTRTAASGITQVTHAHVYESVLPRDFLLCGGMDGIRVPIEKGNETAISSHIDGMAGGAEDALAEAGSLD